MTPCSRFFPFLNSYFSFPTYSFAHPERDQIPQEQLNTTASRIKQFVLVQPEAHVGYGEAHVPVQMAYLRQFHQTSIARFGHGGCMGVINLANFGMLSSLSHSAGLPVDTGALLALSLGGLAIRTEKVSGALATVAFFGLYAGARCLSAVHFSTTDFALLAAGFSVLQAFSHALENVPYPYSTNNKFQSIHEWWNTTTLTQKLRYSTAAFWGTALEWWASPRLYPYLFLESLLQNGYRPDLNATIESIRTVFSSDSRFNFEVKQDCSNPNNTSHYRIETR